MHAARSRSGNPSRKRLLRCVGGAAGAVVLALLPTQVSALRVDSGSISGTVTSQGTGLPLEGVPVYLRVDFSPGIPVAATNTDEFGHFEMTGLADDDYYVHFAASDVSSSEFYDDKPSLQTSDPVTVSGGAAVTGIDAAVVEKGSISGTITGLDGGPLEDICVYERDERGRGEDGRGKDGP